MSLLVHVIEGVDEEEKHRHASPGESDAHEGRRNTRRSAAGARKRGSQMMMPNDEEFAHDGHVEGHDDHNRDMRRYAFRSKWWTKFVTLLEWWEDLEEPPRSGLLYSLVHSQHFEYLCSAVIVANCLFTAYVADWNSQHLGQDKTHEMRITELGFLAFYFVELGLRLTVHGIYFFANEDARWNWFDLCLVVLSIGDEILSRTMVSASAGVSVGFVRIFRIMKMAKIFRTLRVMKVFKELSVILQSFINCVVSLFWCLITLAFIFYVFALVLLQGMTAHLEEAGHSMTDDEIEQVRAYFGSLRTSMLTLYMAVTGGDDWGNSYSVVQQGGAGYDVFYLFFTFFSTIAVFNILTGVFVEKAVEAASPDEEAQIIEHRKQNASITERLKEIVQHMDEDGDGFISLLDFQHHMSNEYLLAYMSLIGLEIRDAIGFFEILSHLGCRRSGKVELGRFIEGCVSLKGTASALDVHGQKLETVKLQEQLSSLESRLFDKLANLEALMPQSEVKASCPKVSEYVAASQLQQSAGPCSEQGVPSPTWRPYAAEPSFKRQSPDVGCELKQQEKAQQYECVSSFQEDTASTVEFDSVLDRFRGDLTANIVPYIVTSVCNLAEQQLFGRAPGRSSAGGGADTHSRRCPDAGPKMPSKPGVERSRGDRLSVVSFEAACKGKFADNPEDDVPVSARRQALEILKVQEQLSSLTSTIFDKFENLEARMWRRDVIASSPQDSAYMAGSPLPHSSQPFQPSLKGIVLDVDGELKQQGKSPQDECDSKYRRDIAAVEFRSVLESFRDEVAAKTAQHIVSNVCSMAEQQFSGRPWNRGPGDRGVDTQSHLSADEGGAVQPRGDRLSPVSVEVQTEATCPDWQDAPAAEWELSGPNRGMPRSLAFTECLSKRNQQLHRPKTARRDRACL